MKFHRKASGSLAEKPARALITFSFCKSLVILARLFNSGYSKTVILMDTVFRSVAPLYHNKTLKSPNCSCFFEKYQIIFLSVNP